MSIFAINALTIVQGVVAFKSICESLETEPIKHERNRRLTVIVFGFFVCLDFQEHKQK